MDRLAAGFLLCLALFLGASCADRRPEPSSEIVVSAASSLGDVMTELADLYMREHPDVTVRNNFSASGTLAQQIRQGAGVDLFVSAAVREMDLLARENLLEPGSRRVLASNELVLVVPGERESLVRRLDDLASPSVQRVALGAPASVPAGAYARAALERLGLWEAVSRKAVLSISVRQALTYVERGEVDAALVYRTDALRSSGVRVVDSPPAGSHPPIVYPAALIAGSARIGAARHYLDFLAGPAAGEALRRHGFRPPPAGSAAS